MFAKVLTSYAETIGKDWVAIKNRLDDGRFIYLTKFVLDADFFFPMFSSSPWTKTQHGRINDVV